jgi:hypothetical protein
MSLKDKPALIILICVVIFVTLSGCASDSSSTGKPTAAPSPAPTVMASATPTAAPVSTPSPVAEPAPISLVGSWQQSSQMFHLEKGLSIFSIQHQGSGNFTIWLVDRSGRKVDLLVNAVGEFSGSKAEEIANASEYHLAITSDGQWAVDITQPRPVTAQPVPLSMTGVGQHATRFFSLKHGSAIFRMTHNGTSDFAVWLDDVNGKHIDLLANAVGMFDGSRSEDIDRDGIYLLDVNADGDWKIDVSY